jgi:hypothetical protein
MRAGSRGSAKSASWARSTYWRRPPPSRRARAGRRRRGRRTSGRGSRGEQDEAVVADREVLAVRLGAGQQEVEAQGVVAAEPLGKLGEAVGRLVAGQEVLQLGGGALVQRLEHAAEHGVAEEAAGGRRRRREQAPAAHLGRVDAAVVLPGDEQLRRGLEVGGAASGTRRSPPSWVTRRPLTSAVSWASLRLLSATVVPVKPTWAASRMPTPASTPHLIALASCGPGVRVASGCRAATRGGHQLVEEVAAARGGRSSSAR